MNKSPCNFWRLEWAGKCCVRPNKGIYYLAQHSCHWLNSTVSLSKNWCLWAMGEGIFQFYLPFLPENRAELGKSHVHNEPCLQAQTRQAQSLGLWPIHRAQKGEIEKQKWDLGAALLSAMAQGIWGFCLEPFGSATFWRGEKNKGKILIMRDILCEILWNIWGKDAFRFCFGLVGVWFHHHELSSFCQDFSWSWAHHRGVSKVWISRWKQLLSWTDQRRYFGAGCH